MSTLQLDVHADQGSVAIALGLSPRVTPSQALLPVATCRLIEPVHDRRASDSNGDLI